MESVGETCKLCLKYVQGEELTTLDENILGKLEFLQMDLDHSVEESNSLCIDCEEKINNASDFKSCLVKNEYSAPSGSESQELNGDIPSTSTGETSAEKTTCHLCKSTVDKISVISLFKLLKDDCMMEVFQGHISEVSLNDTENSMVCECCQKSLASFSTLVSSWSIANDWNDDDTKDDMDDFELSEVKKEDIDDVEFSENTNSSSAFDVSNSASPASTSKKGKGKRRQSTSAAAGSSKKIKTELDEVSDSSNSASLASIKKEETEENEDANVDELQLKSEEIDIKNEDEEGRSRVNKIGQHGRFKRKSAKNVGFSLLGHCKNDQQNEIVCPLQGPDDKRNVSVCGYVTKKKVRFQEHSSTDIGLTNNVKNGDNWKNGKSKYIRTYRSPGQRRSANEEEQVLFSANSQILNDMLKLYFCDHCLFKTNERSVLRNHLTEHRLPKDQQVKWFVPKYVCQICSYRTPSKITLIMHLLNHTQTEENQKIKEQLMKFKCRECPFKSSKKFILQKHLLTHRPREERKKIKKPPPVLECRGCNFSTIHRSTFKRHMFYHKPDEEIQKCYEARKKSKENLPTLQCPECSFQTKLVHSLKGHMYLHKSTEERQKRRDKMKNFDCPDCSYTTKYSNSLKKHVLTHKSPEERRKLKESMRTFGCVSCSYTTIDRSNLRKHLLIHKRDEEQQN